MLEEFHPLYDMMAENEEEKNKRPSWAKLYLSFANLLKERSTCQRASVGCVIASADNNRVLAIGYNGNYKNGPNICDSDAPGACGCIHAELNALIKLDYNDPSDKVLYCTHSPCYVCAKHIINANIKKVIYLEPYRKREGLELLQKNSIDTFLFDDIFIPKQGD